MEITREELDGVLKLSINGRLDAVSSTEADQEFSQALEGGSSRLVLDLTELEYISSAGLRILLVLAKKVQQKGGKVALCSLSENVREVFEISGFSSIFTITTNADEALAAVG